VTKIRVSVVALSLPWCLASLQHGASADDAAVVAVGGAIKLMKGHPQVRMVSENVFIKLAEAKVRCQFVFQNEGPATTVTMGFPESGYGDGRTLPKWTALRGFRSCVDGRPVRVTRNIVPYVVPNVDGYQIWWVKRVPFGAKQRRTVTVQYIGGTGGDSLGMTFFQYELHTGASWKGPVGYARLECDASGMKGCGIAKPGPSEWRNWRLVREYRNREFTEDDDLWVDWWPGFNNFVVNGQTRHIADVTMMETSGFAAALPCEKRHRRERWTNRKGGNSGPYSHTSYPPTRVGNEVLIHVRTLACMAGMDLEALPHGRIRLSKGTPRWCEVALRSHVVKGSTRTVMVRKAVAPRFAPYREGRVEVPLTAVVRALGGSARWNRAGDTIAISAPWKTPGERR
jgi:hypothetical protein